MKRFEDYLKKTLPKIDTIHPNYNKAISHILLSKAKRFRPSLLLKVVEAYNPLMYKNSLAVAVAIEYIHSYSLIHDDLPSMDNAKTRRGKATLHIKYDEATAILIGDALNTHSFNILANCSLRDDIKIKLIQVLSSAGGLKGMVLGQAMDIYFQNKELDIEDVKELYKNKTAKLIAASLLMGAIIVDLDKNLQNSLYNFGIELGVLFQIQDDIIDETLSSKEAGKDTKKDIDKNSFINILGLEKSKEEANKISLYITQELKFFNSSLQEKLFPLIKRI